MDGNQIFMLPIVIALLACASADDPPATPDADWQAELDEWKAKRDASLRQPAGWLSLAGLFWLDEGANFFGSASDNDLVFPASAPPRMGSLLRAGAEVVVDAADGVELTNDGRPVTRLALVSDAEGAPTVLEHGSLSFFVIARGDRVGIRLKDSASEVLRAFDGMDYYPVDPAWRIEARWEPFAAPQSIEVPNILGDTSTVEAPGEAVFEIAGVEYQLTPTGDPAKPLFFVFGDETNGVTTYGGGRFLYAGPPEEGRIVLDFNRAYNPPCVFTPWATCPLPRREDKLSLAIEAGEKMFGGSH